MAVELMVGSSYKTNSSNERYASMNIMDETAVHEAAAAGLQSMEKLIKLLSHQVVNNNHHHHHQQQQQQPYHNNKNISANNNNNNNNNNEFDLNLDLDCKAVADIAVDRFRKVISLLDRSTTTTTTRTGHARFRRGPLTTYSPSPPGSSSSSASPSASASPPIRTNPVSIQPNPPQNHPKYLRTERTILESNPHGSGSGSGFARLPPLPHAPIQPNTRPHHHNHHHHHHYPIAKGAIEQKDVSTTTINFSSASPAISAANSFVSSLTGETESVQPSSMSSSFQMTNLSGVSSAGRPPISISSLKRKCGSMDDSKCGGAGGSTGRCHCSKRRKSRVKRVIRVPAISLKMADIPPDDYSWRKYGQKPIKGSPHPRGYYKCSSVRGCPARKHVERALDDPAMLIVTYEGDHNHSQCVSDPAVAVAAPLVLESS